jgi:hypothetical protein
MRLLRSDGSPAFRVVLFLSILVVCCSGNPSKLWNVSFEGDAPNRIVPFTSLPDTIAFSRAIPVPIEYPPHSGRNVTFFCPVITLLNSTTGDVLWTSDYVLRACTPHSNAVRLMDLNVLEPEANLLVTAVGYNVVVLVNVGKRETVWVYDSMDDNDAGFRGPGVLLEVNQSSFVVVGSRSSALLLNATNGRFVVSLEPAGEKAGPSVGLRALPACSAGKESYQATILLATADCVIWSIDATKESLNWKYEMTTKRPFERLCGSNLLRLLPQTQCGFTGVLSAVDLGTGESFLGALDLRTGAHLWLNSVGFHGSDQLPASIELDVPAGVTLVTTFDSVLATHLNGNATELWSYNLTAFPAFTTNRATARSQDGSKLYATVPKRLDRGTSDPRWSCSLCEIGEVDGKELWCTTLSEVHDHGEGERYSASIGDWADSCWMSSPAVQELQGKSIVFVAVKEDYNNMSVFAVRV